MSAADMLEEKIWIIIRCERSVTIIILIRLDYLVYSFGNYTITLSTDIGNCKRSFRVVLSAFLFPPGGVVVSSPTLDSVWPSSVSLAYFRAAPISIGNHMVGSL